MHKIAEFSIIEDYFKPLTNNNKSARNLGDDTAILTLKQDEELVISKDLMVEDIHFLLKDGGFKIAAKLLLTNLSDLAAAGAKPVAYMLGFSKNNNVNKKFIKDFADGLKKVQDQYKLDLIGGDTVFTNDKLFFSITIFGKTKKNQILSRKNAKNNDLIFVTGNIGDAYLSRVMGQEKYDNKHFFPTPLIDFAQALLKNNLSKCAIDISDGLLADLKHICDQSKISAFINLPQMPVSDKKVDLLDLISAGDDYQLIFSANKKNHTKILELAKKMAIKVSNIGVFRKTATKPDIIAMNSQNKKVIIKKYGYQH